jgi:hypothetical protein
MSNFKVSRSTLAVATLLGLGALGFSSLSAHADVTGQLMQCKTFSKQKVISCCDRIIKYNKKPIWMIENNQSCHTAVKCILKKPSITYVRKPLCYVDVNIPIGGGSSVPVLQFRGKN